MKRWRKATGNPHRTCIGCRRIAPVSQLVRISSRLTVGVGSGRGAWLCADHPVECLDRAIKSRSVARALRAEPSSDDLAALRAKLGACARHDPPDGNPKNRIRRTESEEPNPKNRIRRTESEDRIPKRDAAAVK